MTDKQREYHERQNALKEAQIVAERSSEEVVAQLKKRYAAAQSALHVKLKEDNRAIKKSFPFLFGARKDYADAALAFMGWSTTHESVAVYNHNGDDFHYEKVREKYRWRQDEDGSFVKGEDGRWIIEGRRKGKWITGKDERVGHPFPLALFETVFDFSAIVLCEGEKDALNLNLYGIPALTMGAATISWMSAPDILSGYDLIVWYDNDRAGVDGGLARLKELQGVGNSIMMVDWLQLDPAASKKDDVTDYLLRHSGIGPDALLKRLRTCAFKSVQSRTWREAVRAMEGVLLPMNSERDEALGFMIERVISVLKSAENDQPYESLMKKAHEFLRKDPIKAEALRLSKLPAPREDEKERFKEWQASQAKGVEALEKATGDAFLYLYFDQIFLREVRKHASSDAVLHWYETFEKVGVKFARYGSAYLFWCNTHFMRIEDEQFHNAINRFMERSRINMKQRLNAPSFKEPTRKSIIDHAYYINELREQWENHALINHQGGIIFIDRAGVIEHKRHDPKYGITYALPFAFDPYAKCERWHKFLDRVMPDKSVQDILAEYVGYLFLPGYIQKFLYLYGTGGNGKSVFITIVEALFDRETVSHLEVASMFDHELDSLNGKMLNISTELSSSASTNKGQIETIKKIVAGEPIQVNPKNSKGYVNRRPPKLLMSGNEKLKGGGLNDGLTRRMILVPFEQTIPASEMDENLEHTIINAELPGVLNWAIAGLLRLVQNNYKFSKSETIDATMEEYRVETDQIYSYIKECFAQYEGAAPSSPELVRQVHDVALIYDERVRIPTKHLYAHYIVWAKETGIGHVLQQRNFTSKLAEKLRTKSVDKRVNEIVITRGYGEQSGAQRSYSSKVSKCIVGFRIQNDIKISINGHELPVMESVSQKEGV